MKNASYYASLPLVLHVFDGGPAASGILDPAREVKLRVKHFSYAYRRTNDTQWVDRLWRELQVCLLLFTLNNFDLTIHQNAAGNGTSLWGDAADQWNTQHFLDTAELTAAFAIAYDWMYDIWSPQQREQIMWSLINNGLSRGLQALTADATTYGWWKSVNGNWNCVSNGGMILGSLAILGDDTSGIARPLLEAAVANAAVNCVNATTKDGSWTETANYWYCGFVFCSPPESLKLIWLSRNDRTRRSNLRTHDGHRRRRLWHVK